MAENNTGIEWIEVRAIAKGMVQGVGYRMTAQYHATKLGVTGSARNLRDGSVEIVAAGKRNAVEALLKTLRNSPGASDVTAFERKDVIPPSFYEGFRIF